MHMKTNKAKNQFITGRSYVQRRGAVPAARSAYGKSKFKTQRP